jgi:hypothetical protein
LVSADVVSFAIKKYSKRDANVLLAFFKQMWISAPLKLTFGTKQLLFLDFKNKYANLISSLHHKMTWLSSLHCYLPQNISEDFLLCGSYKNNCLLNFFWQLKLVYNIKLCSYETISRPF